MNIEGLKLKYLSTAICILVAGSAFPCLSIEAINSDSFAFSFISPISEWTS